MAIEFVDLKRQYQKYKPQIQAQLEEVMSQASFILGAKVKELEETLAQYVGVKYAVGCASGTDALWLALKAYDVKPGDEIITTTFSFIATAEVIAGLKAVPVFVDIDEETYNIRPDQIKAAITAKTRGIIAVNLFGLCADFDQILAIAKERGLFVIEDAAQSFGSEYQGRKACALADMGCTSFFPAKPFGCYGDGGMIFTNDENKARVIRSLRVHGAGQERYQHERVGVNSRLDTLQAAVLLAKWSFFPEEISRRQEIAGYYTKHLRDFVKTPLMPSEDRCVFAQYSVRFQHRKVLMEFLRQNAIPTAIHYPKPLHLQEAFRYLNKGPGSFPSAEKVSEEIFSLPMHPFLESLEQDFIIQSIKTCCERLKTKAGV